MKETISKFAPGAVLMLLGFVLMGFGFLSNQNSIFLVASGAIIFAGIITSINAIGLISNKAAIGVSSVLLVVIGYLGYANFISIDEPIQFMKEKHIRYAEVIQNLKDLREVELTYKKKYQKFCGNMDTLMLFLHNDSVSMVVMNGDVPDTLTEEQALEMGIIQRDTTWVSAMEMAFNDEYMEKRNPRYPLDIDNLRYVPYSDNVEFKVEAGEITRSSGAKVQVFQITDATPFDPNDVMQVGSMTEPTTAGNWKEEK